MLRGQSRRRDMVTATQNYVANLPSRRYNRSSISWALPLLSSIQQFRSFVRIVVGYPIYSGVVSL